MTTGALHTSEELSSGAPALDLAAIEPGALRVLVVGDSLAMTLAAHPPTHTRSGVPLAVHQSTLLGCGIVQGDIKLEGSWFPAVARCAEWQANWTEQTESFQPDVSVILIGAWEVFDRRRDGRLIEVGSPEFEVHLEEQLEMAVSLLGGESRPVFLLTVPCYNARLTGARAKWKDRNDSARRAAVNAVLRKFAEEHSHSVELLGLRELVCPSGKYQPSLNGVELHRDGVHYSAEGTELIWEWLGPFLESAVDPELTRGEGDS